MTCPAFRALAAIANHALDAASFLAHPVAGWTAAADELWARAVHPRDGAERLADVEAEREVGDPCVCYVCNKPPSECVYRSCEQPGVMDVARVHGRTTTVPAWLERERGQWQSVINGWAAAYAEQSRELNLLQADGRGHGKDVGQRAEWPSGHEYDDDPIADCHVPNPEDLGRPTNDFVVGEPTINSELKVGEPNEVTGPALDEEALALLKSDPAAYFAKTRDPLHSSIFRSGGQTKEYGRRPRISTPGPRVTDSDRLDTVIALLEDVRNLLQLSGTFTSDDLMDAARAVDYFTRERFGNVERCGAWGRLATRLETAAETAPK